VVSPCSRQLSGKHVSNRRKVLRVNANRLATVLLLFLAITTANPQVAKKSSGSWHWFQPCKDSSALSIEVLVEKKLVYSSSFPICSTATNPKPEQEKKILKFFFVGGHRFQGEYRTTSAQKIEGNIWQAGADPDALLLGVSFMTQGQILLNTIHIAKPNAPSVWELDRGVVVKTFPIQRGSSD